jgi:hypothetical protein
MHRTEFFQDSVCIAAFSPVVMVVLLCGENWAREQKREGAEELLRLS